MSKRMHLKHYNIYYIKNGDIYEKNWVVGKKKFINENN